MKTQELIELLARRAGPVASRAVQRRLAGAALACILLWVFASRLYRREQLAISA